MKFTFTPINLELAQQELAKYPKERQQSAVMALLTLAQQQNNNYLSSDCIEYVANFLNMPVIKVLEVATFYTMYNLQPVGKYYIQVCANVVCHVRGSNSILQALEQTTNTIVGNTSADGLFTITKVECLGACANAPVIQVNQDYYEDLTVESVKQLVSDLKQNKQPNIPKMVRAPITESTLPKNSINTPTGN